MTIAIRALEPQEWETLRRFWLDSLQSAPVFFGGDSDAAGSPPQMWQTTIRGPQHQLFGLFEGGEDGGTLIGISAVFAQREDPSGQTVIFGMSFILPDYRGRGLSRLLYEARLDWARARPQFRRVILSHAQSNAASRGAHRRFGFVLTNTVLQVRPGGGCETEEHYERLLTPQS